MNSRTLSIPAKTFFAGEYLALEGGPALVVGTKSRFTLEVSEGSGSNPFHPESPAGQFYNANTDFFSKYNLKFNDPYAGEGGFGASSAQFALLHGLFQLKDSVWSESERFFDWHELLKDYRNIKVETGYLPSGADVVGQCCGGMTYFDRNNGKVQTFAWPFDEYGFFIASTGQKLSTHEHLKTVKQIPFDEMDSTLKIIRQALAEVDFTQFKLGLTQFKQTLIKHQWVASHTLDILKKLDDFSGVEIAKGCGALGADVVLVVYNKYYALQVKEKIESLGLKIKADESKIDSGLRVEGVHAKI